MSNFIRSLFGSKKSPSKIKPRMQSRRLELIGLEERVTPAVVASFSGNALTLLSDSNDTFSVSSDANGVISITGTTVTAGDANVTVVPGVGNNPSTVTVNSGAGGAAAVQVLALTGDNAAVETQDITLTNINSTAFNTNFGISFALSDGDDTVRLGGSINLNGIGTLIADNSGGVDAIVLGQGSDLTLTSVSGAITIAPAGSGATNVITLSNNVTINSTSGNVTLGDDVVGAGKNLSINSGSGTVTAIRTLGDTTALGNLTITSTNATSSAISLAAVTSGDVILTGTGDVSVSGVVAVTSINTKSTAGDVIFGNTVTTSAVGGFTSEATLATKATQIANLVDVGAGANALVTGNLVSTNAVIITSNVGTITITGNVDASVAGNDLALTAGSGAVTITGNVGSSSIAFGDLNANGTGSFLASGTVVANNINIGQNTPFTTSVTFAKAVTANVLLITDTGINVDAGVSGTITFSDAITVALGTGATATANTSIGQVNITSVAGAIKVVGNITGLDLVGIDSTSGAITLSGNVTTSGTNVSTGLDGDILIGTGTAGNVLLSGNITTTGTGDIILDNDGTGTLTINGNVSTAATSATNGTILIGIGDINTPIGGSSVTINGTVTTTGTTAGDIYIGGAGGSTVVVNKVVTAGATGDVVFFTGGSTDVINIATGANISAGNNVLDGTIFGRAPGVINLGANITALNDTGSGSLGNGIEFSSLSVNLTSAVSMKASGTSSPIVLLNVNGNQNLTLEATGTIILTSVGQTTPLNTVTVTNSNGVIAGTDSTNTIVGSFNAANVVLSDTTGNISFNKSTVITASLTTAAEFYTVGFGGTTVLSGAPVFLNTAGVNFTGTTSLTSGATITGTATTTVNLGGTIVSGGAFNIGAIGSTTIDTTGFADTVQLILNSSSAASTFASKVVASTVDKLSLLGVGSLTLSGDSSTSGFQGSIDVTNGTLNVTGKINTGSISTATNGTISGAGGTIGNIIVNTGTVAPGGTLNTGSVTMNAATNYSAAVLSTTTASNLKTASAINLGGATLSLPSVAAGLAVNGSFTIINNTAASTVPIGGTFANQAEGSSISAKDTAGNTVAFTVSYKGGDGNDVTLKVTSITTTTPAPTAPAQPMVAGQPALNKFTAIGADAGGAPQVTITFQNGTFVSFLAYASTFKGGVRVALGDVDGNGSTDVITGAGPGGGPQVNVYNVNNATGAVSLQKSLFAFSAPSFTGGVYVAAGDTNADGFDDVIIGAGKTGGSRVQVYAGSATGVVTTSTLNDFFAYSPAFTGGVVVAAGQRNAVAGDEIITAPASSGGYNIKSFNANGTGNTPTVVDNFFAFNNTTSVGGLSLAVGILNSGSIADLIIGTSNGGYGVIVDSATAGIAGVPFAGFTGAIRAGVAEDANGQDFAVALAGPTGGPRISVFSVGATSLTETDNLFVMNTSFKGGLFGTPTL